jgi:hypothetical protein
MVSNPCRTPRLTPPCATFHRFWTLLKAFDHKALHPEVVKFARAKLIYNPKIEIPFGQLPDFAQIAVVDARLLIDYEPRRETARRAEVDLVACYMRMAYSTPKDREYLRSGYPSEPILAEAAAQQMWQFRQQNRSPLDILEEHITSGLLDRGERGELVARLLLISAYDRAVEVESERANEPPRTNEPPHYSKGCKLINFLQQLFSEEYIESILDCRPDTGASDSSLREAFKSAMVRFTHFVRAAHNDMASSEAMAAAYVRGMAFITMVGAAAVDLFIPVLLEDTMIGEQAMTAIAVQIKRRIVSGAPAELKIDLQSLGFFPKPNESQTGARPYISLVMELGVQPKKPKSIPKGGAESKAVAASPSKVIVPKPGLKHHKAGKETHVRFNIFAFGCSSTIYKVILQHEKSRYAFLLATRDFLTEHARQNPQTQEAMRRQKPFWAPGIAAFHWWKSRKLRNQTSVEMEEQEVVICGAV